MKILIIEDDLILLAAYGDVFRTEGFDTMTAPDGKIGLELVESFKPDIILLDLIMPVMNGVEFLKKLKGKQKIIVFSNVSVKLNNPNVKRTLVKSKYTPKQVVNIVKEILSV